ncbi:MAG TPA: PDZ domain-containing protein, partial [Gemmatimonas sp.]|nr:PDZ domain-containing protein [Gemmatimonas sp.]
SVKTVAASELARASTLRATPRAASPERSVSRAGMMPSIALNASGSVVGLSIGGSGSVRDTLGLFINSVVKNGPAEKAGVVEGDRIAAVNGVDVRVPLADIEDAGALSSRATRFIREVQKVAPGGNVTLRVYSGGRYREVTVQSVRSSDLPNQGFRISVGDGSMTMSLPRGEGDPGEGRVFTRRIAPSTIRQLRSDGNNIVIDRAEIERAMEEMRRSLQDMGRDMGRDMRFEFRTDSVSPSRRSVIGRPSVRRIITRL